MEMIKKNISIITGVSIIIISMTIAGIWGSAYNSWTLREQLKVISPLFLEINFITIVIVLCVTLLSFIKTRGLKSLCRIIPPKIVLLLSCILLVGFILVCFVVPRDHRIYYDEDIYQNIGQTIAYTKGAGVLYEGDYPTSLGSFWKRFIGSTGMCNDGKNEYGEYSCSRLEYNKEPNGWPYVLSLVYRVVGVHEHASFITANILFLFSIITVFCIGYLLFHNYSAALYGALVFTLTPEVLIWSNTVAVEPSAAFFPALAVLCVLFFLKVRTTSALFLTAIITAFAVQFRPESIMICAVIGCIFLLYGRDELKKGRFYLAVSLFSVFIIAHLIHIYSVKDMGWGATGAKFSFEYLKTGNLKVNTLFYVMNMRFPLFYTLFFFLGLFLKSVHEKSYQWKEKYIVLIWFILFWGIFLFFYAGSYNYGADVRFSVLSSIPVALLAGNGASLLGAYIKKKCNCMGTQYILPSLIILSFLSFMPFIRAITQEAWAARADHYYAQEMVKMLPEDSIVLTHNPNMFLLWGKNAAQASLATEQRGYFNGFFNRYKGGVYFHYNFWCNVNDELQNSFCKNILNWYACAPIVSFKEKNYEFVLYKVEKK